MKLSKRLTAIGQNISEVNTFADIGTDHAALPIWLIKKSRIKKAIAGDINRGPYEIAHKNVKTARCEDKIEVRLGSGLTVLKPGEADLIVIAGMGAGLIAEIIQDSIEVACFNGTKLILQPNTEPGLLREKLLANGFAITSEDLVFDQGKFYEILWTEFDNNENKEAIIYPGDYEGLIGGFLIESRHPLVNPYLKKKLKEIEDVLIHLELELKKIYDIDRQKVLLERQKNLTNRKNLILKLLRELI